MASSLQFDIPHELGKAEAKRRIEEGLPKLERHIPGGGRVEASWRADDHLNLDIKAMGQTVGVELVVQEAAVKVSLSVPLMLSMMSGAISDFVRTSAQKALAKPG